MRTQTKGDIGVAKASSYLTEHGYSVLVPAFSECLPFDIVAYKNKKFLRIQVKYVSIRRGVIPVETRNISTNANGHTIKNQLGDETDVWCIYCPDLDSLFWIDTKEITKHKSLFTMRIDALSSRIKNPSKVRWAKDYQQLPGNSAVE